jgi:2-polyprenyl-3-methyl-5-hydroxy-6-metoxy-1,4-benzoquinol methylase
MSTCRGCVTSLNMTLVDLGKTPLANDYLNNTKEAITQEKTYPLHVKVCTNCYLVQVEEAVPSEAIFRHDYAYLSSYSASWVAHARDYADAMTAAFHLDKTSTIVEIASNDGYLLQHFKDKGMNVLGIEPAGHAADIAVSKGIPTEKTFFHGETGRALKQKGVQADLMTANNVLAHVPDIRAFLQGFQHVLKPQGVVTFEFPHLLNLLEKVQFDTIYHEHYSYLSLLAVEHYLQQTGLRAFDVQELPTHGGSLRVFACHEGAHFEERAGLTKIREAEKQARLDTPEGYQGFELKVKTVCDVFRSFVYEARDEGKIIAAYGAAAKGNTFLNVCGLTKDHIAFAVDRNPEKQNTLLPGSHIPVHDPEALLEKRPDYVVILPWNLKEEISNQHAYIRDWGGQFVTAVPELDIF